MAAPRLELDNTYGHRVTECLRVLLPSALLALAAASICQGGLPATTVTWASHPPTRSSSRHVLRPTIRPILRLPGGALPLMDREAPNSRREQGQEPVRSDRLVLQPNVDLPPSADPAEAPQLQQAVLGLVTGMGAVGAGVSAALQGRPSLTSGLGGPNQGPEEDIKFPQLLNALWFVLTGLLLALVGGLGYEAYLGPLRPSIVHDTLVSLLAVVSGVFWVRMFRTLASKGVMERKLSRKLIHITSAPLFLLCWPLYSAAPSARFVAAIPPLANSVRLLSAGLGKVDNADAVQAISREGGRKELLAGPLYYVLVLLLVTVLMWRSSLASYAAICLMAGGDGLADIAGRRFGGEKLPWNTSKSWAGSLAMFCGGFVFTAGFVALMGQTGFLPPFSQLDDFGLRLGLVCLVTTIVESLPISKWWPFDDNVSVPGVALLLSAVIFSGV